MAQFQFQFIDEDSSLHCVSFGMTTSS